MAKGHLVFGAGIFSELGKIKQWTTVFSFLFVTEYEWIRTDKLFEEMDVTHFSGVGFFFFDMI
jgi:hypothetical protein